VTAARGAAGGRIQTLPIQSLAPAKLNLGLRVLGRRADGYHELASVFVPLDLADTLELELAPAAEASVSLVLAGESAGVPADASNLAVRAASGFLAEAGLALALRLRVTKRIPVAGGLGGGSSDAAAVLRALASRFPDALSAPALARLALRLGADVPFFLAPAPARVGGIGELRSPLAGLPALAFALVNPGMPLSTASVFAAYDASPRPARRAFDLELGLDLGNDLEPAAEKLCPAIGPLRERLLALGARTVALSGSGPTLFGIFPDAAAAGRALAEAALPAPIWARVAVSPKAG
jgi:4-diphosphocytidyl-2-C-methyl-D-erythritol kinase